MFNYVHNTGDKKKKGKGRMVGSTQNLTPFGMDKRNKYAKTTAMSEKVPS